MNGDVHDGENNDDYEDMMILMEMMTMRRQKRGS